MHVNSVLFIVDYAFASDGGASMAVSYNKMWKRLIDEKMSAAQLRKAAEISPNTMTKFHKDELVSMDVLCRICEILDADFGDIMEYIPEPKSKR